MGGGEEMIHCFPEERVKLEFSRNWGVGEEKCGRIQIGGFYEQISTDLYQRIQATSCSSVCAPVARVKYKYQEILVFLIVLYVNGAKNLESKVKKPFQEKAIK